MGIYADQEVCEPSRWQGERMERIMKKTMQGTCKRKRVGSGIYSVSSCFYLLFPLRKGLQKEMQTETGGMRWTKQLRPGGWQRR
jgi:hypothetical protein